MSDRKVTIAISKDGGHNFGTERQAELGELGQYQHRVRFRRFGVGNDMRVKVRITSPIRADILGMVAEIEQGD